MICYYDAIIFNPKELLTEVVDFLNGNTNNVEDLDTLNNKSNVSKSLKMPSEVYEYLKDKYKKDICRMSHLFGGYSTKWLNKHYGTEQEVKNILSSLKMININLD